MNVTGCFKFMLSRCQVNFQRRAILLQTTKVTGSLSSPLHIISNIILDKEWKKVSYAFHQKKALHDMIIRYIQMRLV